MSLRDPVIDTARNVILAAVAGAVVIGLIVFIAWYLMGRNQHVIEVVSPLLLRAAY